MVSAEVLSALQPLGKFSFDAYLHFFVCASFCFITSLIPCDRSGFAELSRVFSDIAGFFICIVRVRSSASLLCKSLFSAVDICICDNLNKIEER